MSTQPIFEKKPHAKKETNSVQSVLICHQMLQKIPRNKLILGHKKCDCIAERIPARIHLHLKYRSMSEGRMKKEVKERCVGAVVI